MSRSEKKVLTVLIVIYACMDELQRKNAIARVDIKSDIDGVKRTIIACSNKWGTNDRSKKDVDIINANLDTFQKHLRSRKCKLVGPPAIVTFCTSLIDDLMRVTKNTQKLKALGTLNTKLERLHDFCDPTGENVQSFWMAGEATKTFHNIIGWEEK